MQQYESLPEERIGIPPLQNSETVFLSILGIYGRKAGRNRTVLIRGKRVIIFGRKLVGT